MSKDEPTPEERLRRMQAMFSEDCGILAEDYAHFTGISPQDAATPQSKGPRKSGGLNGPQDPGRN